MTSHPAIISLPQTMWQRTPTAAGWKESYASWAINETQRALTLGNNAPIQKDVLGLLPYRPDLVARIGPRALDHQEVRTAIQTHPACALALLAAFYGETAGLLERFLEGSGECIYHLLKWAESSDCALRQTESFYRRTLTIDSYWGFLHAKRTANASLLTELLTWTADERHNYSAAAAYFLFNHPHEAVAPYRDVLLANPFYAYLALPRLSLRGFAVAPEDIGPAPKWACHFALSAFSTRQDEFIALTSADPAWTVELAAGLGWLTQPNKVVQIGEMIARCADGHALQRPAMRFLLDLKQTPVAA
jgi:hypothetical protein